MFQFGSHLIFGIIRHGVPVASSKSWLCGDQVSRGARASSLPYGGGIRGGGREKSCWCGRARFPCGFGSFLACFAFFAWTPCLSARHFLFPHSHVFPVGGEELGRRREPSCKMSALVYRAFPESHTTFLFLALSCLLFPISRLVIPTQVYSGGMNGQHDELKKYFLC